MYARIKYVCSLTHRNFFRVRSRTRANALYRLLTQTGCSLMGLKKTNAAFAALVFFGTHYIINTFILKCYWIFCQM